LILEELLSTLVSAPETIEFTDVISVIEANYDYRPTEFKNGLGDSAVINAAGTNESSCKIFAFAKLRGLNQRQTLACFGDYYRKDVLGNPEGQDHQNIRNFMVSGWGGIEFLGQALFARN